MNASAIAAWIKQPTTINGLGILAGVIAGAVTQALTHQITDAAAVGTALAGIVHLVMPDNSVAQQSVQKLGSDLVTAAVQKRLMQAMPELFADGIAAAQALKPAPQPAAPAAVVTTVSTAAIAGTPPA